jgi:hypothetical protein
MRREAVARYPTWLRLVLAASALAACAAPVLACAAPVLAASALAACGAPAVEDPLATDNITLPDRVPLSVDAGTPGDAAPAPPDTVTLTVALAGAGSVSSTPSGLTCATTNCQGKFPRGAAVTLLATPAVGSVFAGWTSPCAGAGVATGTCVTTLAADLSTSAAFQALSGAWSGTYTNTRMTNGCAFANAGNLTATIAGSGGAFTSSETITGLELRSLGRCQLFGATTGVAPSAPIVVASADTLSGTWTFNVQGAGTLAFPFTAKVAGKTMTGTWTCPTCTGSFTLTTP